MQFDGIIPALTPCFDGIIPIFTDEKQELFLNACIIHLKISILQPNKTMHYVRT